MRVYERSQTYQIVPQLHEVVQVFVDLQSQSLPGISHMNFKAPVPFVKMHGSGNDFVVIHLPDDSLRDSDFAEFTRHVCRRGTGLGADGVLVIRPSDVADFHWHYINADGTDGDMCGNGAMVGARFAVEQGIAGEKSEFETAAGTIRAEVNGADVTLEMVDAQLLGEGLQFDELKGVTFDHLMIGVPHVVGIVDDAEAIDNLDGIGRAIRQDPQLQPAGANVNLIHYMHDNTIRMRTYERGVEAETLACGTGAVCSAIVANRRGLVTQPVTVRVSSGMNLTVTWREDGDTMTDIRLSGTTRIVARGEITPEAFM